MGFFSGGKNVDSVNEPVLLGFSKVKRLNPRRIVIVLIRKSLEEIVTTQLLDLYRKWKEYV